MYTEKRPKMKHNDQQACTNEHENREIFISGFLQIVFLPKNWSPGWINLDSVWFRILDATAFLWLRDRVNTAIESGKLPEAFNDAPVRLSEIQKIAIAHGCFSAGDVSPFASPPEHFDWWAGCPRWAEDF